MLKLKKVVLEFLVALMKNAENSVGTAEKAEKLLKNLASKEQRKVEFKAPSRDDTPIVPYPQRLKKNKLDNQFSKFMEIFKKLHINIPFSDALEKMPILCLVHEIHPREQEEA